MANRPSQTLSLAPSSDTMNDIIFSQPESQSAQSEAPQSPHKPSSPKDVAQQTPPSQSLVARPKNNATPRSARPRLSSTPLAPPEDHTFMPATRHALEQALGKASLDRHEVLLQQEKKHTQDYIAQLQDAVKQKTSIAPSAQESLLRKEITMWKAKAQELDESAKTEMQLLRECNGRMEEELIMVRSVAEGLRREMHRYRVEEEKNQLGYIKMLEEDKEELIWKLSSVEHENDGLMDEAKKFKEEVERLKKAAKGVKGGEGKDGEVEKRKARNLKRRARDRKRRDLVLVKENMELAARLAEMEKQESLEVEDEIWEGFPESDEGAEMVQKDEAVSGEKRKSKKKKKKGKKVIKKEQ
ncbi:hypothetical protein COCC4DRAFT_39771 [Bipolaris maydis ATCC 48331]|uniref:Uncharacterized protein n=2 Tax=Cochliobolus heterostrophus TaxID=5016 RepID=M2T0D2_COCH5|nr:uncharacterized protein COCC4DRAFT_39771 [Bipolaris maydis ATCC 48331]EMD91065.1 hypothetical protein COCHEDRAFT_1204182 [Bipolaris maydis C5]KAJ5022782.1 hypothetical protein J3E73DRAFT_385009 [Bipolaris maydis]ENI05852.1 hypothetical protein COCC4DRAFT_39771 [Bipolaris maydis ATCC 48331]KAJ6205148.1 hypothetical protein PSV09DRAFT_1204182 [Bipolaris maydis]KAJ6268029.1 hypothetical protein PSV08DRAFT_379514 [Bipolaris maydis]